MYAPDGPDTFWLDFTNAGLGLVILLFVVAVAGSIARELRFLRRRKTRRAAELRNILRG